MIIKAIIKINNNNTNNNDNNNDNNIITISYNQ